MRYFIEVSYIGLAYSGFQIQPNSVTIQSVIENVLQVYYKLPFDLTCSSRTDAEVNAFQNFFHFDTEIEILQKHIYNLNSILPSDVCINNIFKVNENAHSRFDAISRSYQYLVHQSKSPFLYNKSFFYPFNLDKEKLDFAANTYLLNTNFESYSKKNTQVLNFNCTITNCNWIEAHNGQLHFNVTANRFLRGMVKALVGTSLNYATNKLTKQQFLETFINCDNTKTNFSPPGYGLYLKKVNYPKHLLVKIQ
jgi:tRNA pseudouridine38-40 synthase